MNLTAVVRLVLKEVRKNIVTAILLYPLTPMNLDRSGKPVRVEAADESDQIHIECRLRLCQGRHAAIGLTLAKNAMPQRSALHRIEIEEIHQVDVVQRFADCRKKAGARSHQFVSC